ncbi:hypothetical protein A2U01_0110156 [Trifolium medium]|uniref:Uncharacterized protein n=1 Tax=Trifolium medium TaxID=97028 RepID=A0A392VKD6_9FABA|nr:hypothetical protein [Trifolium medium]
MAAAQSPAQVDTVEQPLVVVEVVAVLHPVLGMAYLFQVVIAEVLDLPVLGLDSDSETGQSEKDL